MFKLISKLLNRKTKHSPKEHSDEFPYAEVCRKCKCPNCWPNRCRALGIIK